MVFQGEVMTCALCGKRQTSDPQVESDWRYLELDGVGFYVCTDHFPPDGSSSEAFRDAYVEIIQTLATRRGYRWEERPGKR
jgi:hypothetical protein